MKFAEDDKMVTESIDTVTKSVVKYMIANKLTLCTAESCTGGMIAQTVTDVPGASGMFPGGVCSYSEEIKKKVLGVSENTLDKFTVYSEETASEMSKGALRLFGADVAVAVTGLAGPDGGTEEKPVGTVYVSVRSSEKEIVRTLRLYREYENLTRREIRLLTTLKALQMVEELIGVQRV
jgi:PncC family amidohydrolase